MQNQNQPLRGTHLKPTLWRTCRALANRVRLRLLLLVWRKPWCTVSEIARMSKLPTGEASLYLRALNARGLLQVRRAGRHVWYAMAPDPTIPEAREIVEGLRDSLATVRNNDIRELYATVTAFTHPRRLDILRILHERSGIETRELAKVSGIPLRSLRRHLEKLEKRNLVTYRNERWFELAAQNPLGRALTRLCWS